MEIFDLATKDGITLSAILWDANSKKSILLLHMMPATKESWQDLAPLLREAGFNVLAVDFRGHGESEGGDYQTFSPEDHQKYFFDAEAAVEFLQQRYPNTEIYMGGASIGANEALKYMAEHSDVAKKGFALSAGLDYYGVRAVDYAKELKNDQSVLFIGAMDDGRKSGGNCGEMAEQLYDLATCKKDKVIFETGGHGTHLLSAHPDLVDKIIRFLTQ